MVIKHIFNARLILTKNNVNFNVEKEKNKMKPKVLLLPKAHSDLDNGTSHHHGEHNLSELNSPA